MSDVKRRNFLGQIACSLGAGAILISGSQKTATKPFYYSVTHKPSNLPSYQQDMANWLNVDAFKKLNEQFREAGKIVNFKSTHQNGKIVYEWWFDHESSYQEWEKALADNQIFFRDRFEFLAMNSTKKYIG